MQVAKPIPIVDFGGSGPVLHFAHANAYPPRCYQELLRPLTTDFHVLAMEQRPLWSGQSPEQLDDWRLFSGDLIQALEQVGKGAVIGAGHSLGAVVSMMAAVDRPGLFEALVLIEPMLLGPAILDAARSYPDLAKNTSMVQRARNRRNRWSSRQQAFDRFRSKSIFRGLSDDALWDYVKHGLVEAADGHVQLRFDREWEARIYAHPPLDIWETIPQLTMPTLAMRGERSDTVSQESWQRWQTLQPTARFVQLEGAGHLAPFEMPVEIAHLTRDFLQEALGT